MNDLSAGYEVEADLVEVRDERGFRYFFGRGSALPGWVDQDQLDHLAATGAVLRFGVI